ncbi:MAG: hypothetical protein ACEPOW_07575 [Bacteroidales bacterium]
MNNKNNENKEMNAFQRKFKDYESPPPLGAWSDMSKRLDDLEKEDRSKLIVFPFAVSWKSASIAASMLILLSFSSFLIYRLFDTSEMLRQQLSEIPTKETLISPLLESEKLSSLLELRSDYSNQELAYSFSDSKSVESGDQADYKIVVSDEQNAATVNSLNLNVSNPSLNSDNNLGSINEAQEEVKDIQESNQNNNTQLDSEAYNEALKSKFLAENKNEKKSFDTYLSLGLMAGSGQDKLSNVSDIQYKQLEIPVQVNISKSLYLQTGLAYSQGSNSVYSKVNYEDCQFKRENKILTRNKNASGDGDDFVFEYIKTYDTIQTTEYSKGKNFVNQLEIPALMGWHKQIGAFDFHLKGGPNLGMILSREVSVDFRKAEGKNIVNVLGKEDPQIYHKDFFLQLRMATALGIQCSKRISINLEPQWRYYLRNPYQGQSNSFGFDLRFGLSYCFK